ncbi:MAG: YifB family Mg chelatase-like AAA ATPase [Proteobacteria bacterium]|nr:YifB family Mg chelatase-like AAA ATPase [Pseudomonadota bacterium]
MIGRTKSGALLGVDGYCVNIEVQIGFGASNFFTVGLAEGAVRESKVRVRSAFVESDLYFPNTCVTLNLAPADVRKDGSAYDLPIALAILAANGEFRPEVADFFETCMVLGELGLSGEIRPIKGVLPLVLAARKAGLKSVILAPENAAEAALVEGMTIFCPSTLRQCFESLRSLAPLPRFVAGQRVITATEYTKDMSDVSGQEVPKRALEIAASGGHNLIFIGPPGSGKTMLAQRLPTILPDITFDEALEVTALYSVSGNLGHRSLIDERPFRAPHHSISDVGLVGGGSPCPRPGEISLAHHGVLFLDELPEFKRTVLEVLRQPLEDGKVNITRRLQCVQFPSQFMLIASMNACPCGNLGSRRKPCVCRAEAIEQYQSRISGPLLDRIDLQLEVSEISYEEIQRPGTDLENSQTIRARVEACRNIQRERFANTPIRCNAQMGVPEIRQFCALSPEGHKLMQRVIDRLGMSARAHHRILKVARTIADMAGEHNISPAHLSEAIGYRILDRKRMPASNA